jgi:hypothetical protein
VKWLLSTRMRELHATRREGREEVGRAASTVKQQATWMRNHVWPTLFAEAGFPTGQASAAYWQHVREHVDALLGGSGGGVQQLASVVQAGAQDAQAAAGADAATAVAVDAASRAAQMGVRAATAPSTTREHLNQTGEYILQDALLGSICGRAHPSMTPSREISIRTASGDDRHIIRIVSTNEAWLH